MGRTAAVGGRLDARQRRGAEAQVRVLRADRVVQYAEDLARRVLRRRRGAHGVSGECGERGSLRALAADVADHGGPGSGAAPEDVVEVPADLVGLSGGEEARGRLEPVDLGERAWQKAVLED